MILDMTNEESKQKVIHQAWESLGFVVDGLTFDNDGVLMLPNIPQINAMPGLENLHAENSRAWQSMGFYFIQLRSLSELHLNNGWTRIDGLESLPREAGIFTVMNKDNEVEDWGYSGEKDSVNFWLEYFTHWRPVVEIPKPIY